MNKVIETFVWILGLVGIIVVLYSLFWPVVIGEYSTEGLGMMLVLMGFGILLMTPNAIRVLREESSNEE